MALHGVICWHRVRECRFSARRGIPTSTGFLEMSLASHRVPSFVSVGKKEAARSFPTGMVKVGATLRKREVPSEWKEEEKRKCAFTARRLVSGSSRRCVCV